MSASTAQIHRTLTSRHERRELLVLACEVDRLAWQQACRPTRGPGVQFAFGMLRDVQTFVSLVPGRLGRWLRNSGVLTDLGRLCGWPRY